MEFLLKDANEMDHEKQLEVLDNHLRLTEHMYIKSVEKDGLCIFTSMKEVLEEKRIFKTINELIDILRNELSSDLENYKNFSPSSIDIMYELETFLENPNKSYVKESVDLFLHALSKGLKIKSKVYQINEHGKINTCIIGEEKNEIDIAIFAKTSILHIDPVLCIVNQVKLEEITNDTNYTCPLCSRIMSGPLRLKRHIAVCTPPVHYEEDTKVFTPKIATTSAPILIPDSDDDEPELASNEPILTSDIPDIPFQDNEDFVIETNKSTNEISLDDSDISDQNITISSLSSEEEIPLIESVTSPYEPTSFTSFKSYCTIDNDIQRVMDLLRRKDISEFIVKERVPWHVSKSSAFVIDPTTFCNKDDITVDCWTWELSTYKCSITPDANGEIPSIIDPKKSNDLNSFRIIKRNYTCKQNRQFKKRITSILKPGIVSDHTKRPFEEVDSLILLQYAYPSDHQHIPPSSKPRTYPSVKGKLKDNLKSGNSIKKATYLTEKEVGGFDNVPNSSFLPSRNQAKYIHDKESSAQINEDPLRQLIERQHMDQFKFIRKIETNGESFSIFLIADNQLHNIANFCTTDNDKWKSELSWDFTFKLGKFDVLVISYRNTSIISKRTKRSPSMLGGLLICHRRNHDTVKVACDQLISLLPGLKSNLKVNVCDGEKAIINNICEAFPCSLLMLCIRHCESNVRDNLPLLPKVKKDEILSDIFGNGGIVDSLDFEEFNFRTKTAYAKWEKNYGAGVVKEFISYFEKNKAEEFKHHVMKGAVKAAKLNGNLEKVYNNNMESLNNVIKKWQGNKEVDLYKFVDDIEELVRCQDSEVFRAFLKDNGAAGNSSYHVHPDFETNLIDFNSGYSSQPLEKKKELKEKCINVVVDPVKYQEVLGYNVGEYARATARKNIQDLLPVINTKDKEPEKMVEILINALSHIHSDVIRDIVRKSFEIKDNDMCKEIIKNTEWWVKSSGGPHPHVVQRKKNGTISCKGDCQGFKIRSICAHVFSVALSLNEADLQQFLNQLRKLIPSVTKSASSQINSGAGKKKNSRAPSGKRKTARTLDGPSPKMLTPMRTFCLKNHNGNISACFGCSNRIEKDLEFVIVYRDDRFTYGNKTLEKLQNVHFHLDKNCIINKYPDFNFELSVPACIELSSFEVENLEKQFNLHFI